MTDPTPERPTDRALLHAMLCRESAARQHTQALACLGLEPPDHWGAATACHRALQFTRQAEACLALCEELAP